MRHLFDRYFASGTGAAGLVGASLWWVVRGLGVRTGVGISSVRHPISRLTSAAHDHQIMPLVIPLTYFLLLPQPETFASVSIPTAEEEDALNAAPTAAYTPLPTDDDDVPLVPKSAALSAADKWHLVKPLLLKYMLPLCEWDPTITRFRIY